MAEKKYDLALVNTRRDSKLIVQQPWYKERIKTKYIKSLRPGETSFKNLDGRNWRFIKDGLDDFRDGLPPCVDNDCIIPPANKGIGPGIQNDTPGVNYVKQSCAPRGRFNKDQILYSSLTPLKQQKRDNIEEVEYGLTQHPLALYPHLEECLSAEVFEDVVDLLDPQMNVASDTSSLPDERVLRFANVLTKHSLTDEMTKSDSENKEELRNPYYWLPKREEAPTGAKKIYLEKKEKSKAQERHIHGVTRDFCDWVAGLGGDTNNIEEATITSLFASGYETKPALSVPIHVVELTNVPLELRISAGTATPEEPSTVPTTHKPSKPWANGAKYEPSWVKFQYGAWYLHPRTWKKRDHREMLRDPKEVKDEEMKTEQKKNEKLNQELAEIHGTSSFMAFMDRKGTRRPEFLEEIGDIQKRNEEDERKRLEDEHMAKLKRFPNVRVKCVV